MRLRDRLSLFCAALLCAAAASAAEPLEQRIFHPDFSTLRVAVEGSPYAPPVITLGGSDRIVVDFDERADERRHMRYELIHCNADWRPSRLLESEYVDGFNECPVEWYDFSRLAENRYVHYRISLPDDNMRLRVSGNYLLRVYDEEDPDDTILQARFYVSEECADMGAQVSSRTDVDYNDAHQQLSVSADTRRAGRIDDPMGELVLIAQQNGRNDNLAVVTRPQRIVGTQVVYEHIPALIFPAGNEYRRFENVNQYYPGMGIDHIVRSYPIFHYVLATDRPRYDQAYLFDRTQHGRFTPHSFDRADPDLEADYGLVHFSLEMPRLLDADIYIDGDLTGRRFDTSSRMLYNAETGRYEASLLLKQGSYNYQYLVVPQGRSAGETARIEGDKFQTVNEYAVRLYHRRPGARYDRLIGTTLIFSGS